MVFANANSRSIGIERCTPKFLKNWETQLFQKYLGIRFSSDTKDALFGFAEVSASPNFSAGCIFHLHSASVGSRRLIPSCVHLNATWYKIVEVLMGHATGREKMLYNQIDTGLHIERGPKFLV